ncbi:MAG: PAS domain S-box protein [Phycisphaerae bacterium]|nr:PAS domain S-box protein [Phycisphaerae bacterium]
MSKHEDNREKQNDKETASHCSSPNSVEQLRIQLQNVEKVLRTSEEKSLNLIEILKKSRSDFLAIFDSVPAIIWYRDRDGKILRANQCAADSVGVGVRELVGKNYYELVPVDAERSHQQDVEVIVSGWPLQGVLQEFKMADGVIRWMVEDRIPLRDKAGKVIGVMVFSQDVTEKKLAKERLIQAKKEIEIRNEQLSVAAQQSKKLAEHASRSNLAKSEILASSSHDLRTPMNAIIGFAELLQDTQLDAEQQEYMQTIHKSATSLLSLINDILDFTKIEVGKLNIQIISCGLSAFIQDIRSMMEPGIIQKGLDFNIQIDSRLPKTFFTDPIRLRQCMVNLIGNAMKFTSSGSISLFVKPERRRARSCIRFDVEDTGIGIPKDKQRRIFQSYSQAEDTTEKTYGGTGLGLTITQKLVDLLGGHISVVSKPGKGSVFSIVLPLVDSVSSDVFDPDAELQMSQSDESRKICRGHILVTEANLPSQLTMNLLLRRVGLSVEIASNPQQLYEKAAASEFDIIIVDLMGDEEQDIPVIEKLRALKKDVSIIAIAPCDLELMKKTLVAGCNKYLTKPVSRRQLYETIFELMRQAAFEKKLKSITLINDKAEKQTPEDEFQPQEPFEIIEETFEPEELVKLLLLLIEELPSTFDGDAMDQIAEVIDVISKVSVFCDNQEYRDKIKEIKEHFKSNLSNEKKNKEMLSQLEQICREVYNCCEKKIV